MPKTLSVWSCSMNSMQDRNKT